MVHACGSTDAAQHIQFGDGLVIAARSALHSGAPILCDSEMVAHGVTRTRLPAGNEVRCTLHDPRVPPLAAKLGTTRSACGAGAVDRPIGRRRRCHRQRADGAVSSARNAGEGRAQASAILGIPVGFVGAAESKEALAGRSFGRSLSDCARSSRRQRHDGRRHQCAGEGRI